MTVCRLAVARAGTTVPSHNVTRHGGGQYRAGHMRPESLGGRGQASGCVTLRVFSAVGRELAADCLSIFVIRPLWVCPLARHQPHPARINVSGESEAPPRFLRAFEQCLSAGAPAGLGREVLPGLADFCFVCARVPARPPIAPAQAPPQYSM